MLVKPSVTDLLTKVDNRYTLVIMVSKRARQKLYFIFVISFIRMKYKT